MSLFWWCFCMFISFLVQLRIFFSQHFSLFYHLIFIVDEYFFWLINLWLCAVFVCNVSCAYGHFVLPNDSNQTETVEILIIHRIVVFSAFNCLCIKFETKKRKHFEKKKQTKFKTLNALKEWKSLLTHTLFCILRNCQINSVDPVYCFNAFRPFFCN